MLFQDSRGWLPDDKDAADYAEYVDEEAPDPGMFVGSDETEQVFDSTPYDGRSLPGKCVLTPEMEMYYCTTGHGSSSAFDAVEEHAGSR